MHLRWHDVARTTFTLNHALLRIRTGMEQAQPAATEGDDIALDLEMVQSALQILTEHEPVFAKDIALLGHQIASARRAVSPESLGTLLAAQEMLADRLNQIDAALAQEREELWGRYHVVHDRITLLAVLLNLIGALVVGTLVTLFFTRLTWDLDKLGRRGLELAEGYRGPPLQVTRTDEVGVLMKALNRMQEMLRLREGQLALARERHFRHEKMAAMGSLAAAVAHEINNPIAAITGIARAIRDAGHDASAQAKESATRGADLILQQADRISAISRQVATFTRPPSEVADLIDLNALVRNTCSFISYDDRFRAVALELALDPALPAVTAIADHVTQALLNLMINAADAMKQSPGRKPVITVATARQDPHALLRVSDNGPGMDAATLARAFDEGFTTKPEGDGRGLGLFLCKTIVEGDGGRITLESIPGQGTTASVFLPIDGPPKT